MVASRFDERHSAQSSSSVNVLQRSQCRIVRVAASSAVASRCPP
jgi:hypothetical protein